MPRHCTIWLLAMCLGAACSTTAAGNDGGTPDSGVPDSGVPDSGLIDGGGNDGGVSDGGDAGVPDGGLMPDAGVDAGLTDGGPCPANGNIGQCISVSSCSALSGYSSTPGVCTPADLECCSPTPDLANNPPTPSGWQLLPQASVTPDMTTWAEQLVNDPTDYPMFSSAMMTFGSLNVLAIIEWLPPDLQNSAIHRGVVLFEPQ